MKVLLKCSNIIKGKCKSLNCFHAKEHNQKIGKDKLCGKKPRRYADYCRDSVCVPVEVKDDNEINN